MALKTELEWLNKNLASNYPIMDDCSCKSTTGVVLPSNFIADLYITTPPTGDDNPTSRFFISSVRTLGDSLQISISYQPANNGSSFECLRSGDIPVDLIVGDTVASRQFNLVPSGDIPSAYKPLYNAFGGLIIGTCEDMRRIGGLNFTYQATRLLPSCIVETLAGLQRVTVITESGTVVDLTGSFALKGGAGIALTATQNRINGTNVTTVLISRKDDGDADKYPTVDAVAERTLELIGTVVETINGAHPQDGNFTIEGADCVGVENSTHGITLTNQCAKPCCTSGDIPDVTRALSSLEASKELLYGLLNSISTQLTNMQSRLASLIATRES